MCLSDSIMRYTSIIEEVMMFHMPESIDSSCMTNIKTLPHKMADFICIHWVNCISEYSKVKLERNYVQLFYCQPLTSLRTTHLIR